MPGDDLPVIPAQSADAEIPAQRLSALEQQSDKASAVAVAVIGAVGLVVSAAVPGVIGHFWPPPSEPFDCVKARVDAMDYAAKYPAAVGIPFSGEQQDQCQLNEVMQQVREAAKPTPATR